MPVLRAPGRGAADAHHGPLDRLRPRPRNSRTRDRRSCSRASWRGRSGRAG